MTRDVAEIVEPTDSRAAGGRALQAAAMSWFVVAAVGQVLFAAYVVAAYGPSIVLGRFEGWNKTLPPGHGYVPGDPLGNFALLLHLSLVVVVMVGGLLQLIPAIRRRWPAFHRWTGRAYLASVLIVTIGGLALKLTREPVATPLTELATKVNAVVILGFAAMAFHRARARQIASHRRWALRLFLAASGVWFVRILWAFWRTIANGIGVGPVDGLFTVISFGQFVLPLLVLELYFRARERGGPRSRIAMAATLGGLTLATAVGIVAATLARLPRL
jgi:hypothetical protein